MTELHEGLQRDEEVVGSSNRNFGLLFAAIATIIAIHKFWIGSHLALLWSVIAALLLAVSLFFPQGLTPFNRAWTKLGLLMFYVINPVVMLLMYGLTMVPIGLIMRLMGKDLLRLQKDTKSASYWIERTPAGPSRESMPLQF